jgi:hypothetical protein
MIWEVTTKGDPKARAIADRHYTRQSPGHPQWTRPGYSAVLVAESAAGRGLFVWWRPKWEDGRPGTARKDGLRCLECTHFRREGPAAGAQGAMPIASAMISDAVEALGDARVRAALHMEFAGELSDGLITGVGSVATSARRSKGVSPGRCFEAAGWQRFDKRGSRADVWLTLRWQEVGR